MHHASIYNRFVRWSRMGILARIFAALTAEAGIPEQLMIDSTHLKAHRGQPGNKGGNTLPQCLRGHFESPQQRAKRRSSMTVAAA
jgi:transposase